MYHIIHMCHNPVISRLRGQYGYDTSTARYHNPKRRKRPVCKGYDTYDMYDS